jgi:hypothetical protein
MAGMGKLGVPDRGRSGGLKHQRPVGKRRVPDRPTPRAEGMGDLGAQVW